MSEQIFFVEHSKFLLCPSNVSCFQLDEECGKQLLSTTIYEKLQGFTTIHRHFCQSRKFLSPLSFISILGRKYFGGPGEKTH